MCDLVNHTRFPKEDHLPDWARRDYQVKKGDRVHPLPVFFCHMFRSSYVYVVCITSDWIKQRGDVAHIW